ncbi:MAG TPA: hypothetical protein VHM65_05190 [Candidatus Lustribacter sp.]|nr:hypothetical protein [Candidatus Lustribacter sp.]
MVHACESPVALTRRARKMYRVLAERYPYARCELDFTTPLELLVATILSAQTTDVRVNLVTPVLFEKYRTATDYAGADRAEVESVIASTGFFRAKTVSLLKLGAILVERYDGQVPSRLADLVSLPGSAARRPMSSSAMRSASPASRSTRTSGGSRAGSGGPRRRIRSRSSTPSVR